MKRIILPVLVTVICWSGVKAQDDVLPSRSLTIEGSYNPSMSEQGKIMPVPERPQTERQAATVSYRTEANPHQGYERTPMGVFGEQSDDVEENNYYGLVRLGYGLRNVSDGLLDAGWKISDRDLLTISGLMDGWSTKPDGEWKSKMFNGDLKADYSHRFDSMTVGIYVGYGHSGFNYREGKDTTSAIIDASNFNQKINRAEAGLWLNGEFRRVEWHLDAGMQWLSRKGLNVNGNQAEGKERLLRINAGLEMPLLGGRGGLDYNQKTASYKWQGIYGAAYSNFTTLTLSPYWKQTWGNLDARLGLNLDVRTAAGKKLLASLMLTASYNLNDQFKILAGITGGLKDNSMRTLAGISPYWSEAEQIRDGYEMVNASIGASYSQGTWLTLSLRGGYRHTMDDLFQVVQDSIIKTSLLRQEGLDVMYARLDADMQFADRAQVKMEITGNAYTGKYSEGALALKPVLDGSLFGKVNIIPGLDVLLTYRAMLFGKVDGTRMPMVNDVALTLDYDFRPNLSFYLTGNRLAGGNYYYYAGYRAIKPSVLVGLTYRF
ncbi:MAG: hypothetical protein IKX55_00300 [Bacteroidaceae bacterium]|nr:hypothetical protein [Bacteroidaceae bacterium]